MKSTSFSGGGSAATPHKQKPAILVVSVGKMLLKTRVRVYNIRAP